VAAAFERWALTVLLDSVDISDQLVGSVQITAEETASGLCTFEMIPAAGAVDPNDYENVSVSVAYLTKDAAGATLTTTARFSGVTTRAVYDSDNGVLTIEATNDLQGTLEGMTRAAIDTLISSGTWSKHVFDDGADNWQYAQDRLSTTPAELHVDPDGTLVVVNWAAKVTPDVTLTDGERFNNTLRLTRNTRRDLISKNVVNFDFRFTRLRHRKMSVVFTYTPGICGYLDGDATVPQRSMIQSAADSNSWVRISDISFTDFPDTGTICSGKNWVKDGSEFFCLGASWTAARRWAQTVTEEYAITVNAPDIEAAVGVQQVTESYGVEAIYDARDYESITEYDAEPAGSVLATETDDYQLDADQTTANGRTEMEAAQEVAIAKARTEILGRARGNRVSVGAVYDPSITLASTVRVNTPSLTAKGKVYSYVETLNTANGELNMQLDLAISRHGGSGIATDDPITAPTQPAQPAETPTSRTYSVGVHIGGVTGASADDPTWDGYICNAYGAAQTDPTNLYRERFVLNMPAIEETARNATEVQQAVSYEVEVPQDELTMSY